MKSGCDRVREDEVRHKASIMLFNPVVLTSNMDTTSKELATSLLITHYKKEQLNLTNNLKLWKGLNKATVLIYYTLSLCLSLIRNILTKSYNHDFYSNTSFYRRFRLIEWVMDYRVCWLSFDPSQPQACGGLLKICGVFFLVNFWLVGLLSKLKAVRSQNALRMPNIILYWFLTLTTASAL